MDCYLHYKLAIIAVVVLLLMFTELTFTNVPKIKEMLHNWLSKIFAFFSHSSLIHLAMDVCLSEMKDLTIIPVANKYPNASLNAMNSIAELLPAWLAWRENKSKKVHKEKPLLKFSLSFSL